MRWFKWSGNGRRSFIEELKPVENDPVSILLEKKKNLSEREGGTAVIKETPAEELSDVLEPGPEEAGVPAEASGTNLMPPQSSKQVKKKEVREPYDPLLSLIKTAREAIVEKRALAIDDGPISTEKINGPQMEPGPEPLESSNRGPVQEISKSEGLSPAGAVLVAEAVGQNTAKTPEDPAHTAVSSSESQNAGSKISASATGNSGPAEKVSSGGGILDVFREELEDKDRTLCPGLEMIEVHSLLEEAIQVKKMLQARRAGIH